jgi:hypothetical protein
MKTETPTPGSDAALKLGCTCGSMDNRRGRGCYLCPTTGEMLFIINATCPVHGLASPRTQEAKP